MFSVSNAFERKRKELNRISKLSTSLTSSETLHLSEQLDHFVNLYQNQNLSEFDMIETLDGSLLTVFIRGQLDIASSEVLSRYLEINEKRWCKIDVLHLDLSDLYFLDTTGIWALLELVLEARDNNVLVKIIGIRETIAGVFDAIGITGFLKNNNCEI